MRKVGLREMIVGLMDKELRGPYSENAVEPVGWSQMLIRNTWLRSIFGLLQ